MKNKKYTKASFVNLLRNLPLSSRRNMLVALVVAVGIAIVGYTLVITFAAGHFASLEAESGTINGNASQVSDSNASGGQAIKFGAVASGGCALPNYPDATCTGVPAGTSLTVVNGDMNINTANTVVENKDIRGCVNVSAPGVIIRKSKITCSGPYLVDAYGFTGTWLTIEDSELFCDGNSGTGIGEERVTVLRVNLHSCENGFDVNKFMTIKDSYIHDLVSEQTVPDAHTDGLQLWNTAEDVTIEHNTIYPANYATSAIISPSQGTKNILIKDNLMAGAGYTIYCRQNGAGDNYRVINNRFSTKWWPKSGWAAAWTECEDEVQVTGNVYHESGLPVPL